MGLLRKFEYEGDNCDAYVVKFRLGEREIPPSDLTVDTSFVIFSSYECMSYTLVLCVVYIFTQ